MILNKILVLFFLFGIFSCQSQNFKKNDQEYYELINSFLNQAFTYKDTFYLDRIIKQSKLNPNLILKYNNKITQYNKSDSICKVSKQISHKKVSCQKAFYLKDYFNLFNDNQLSYLKSYYSSDENNSFYIKYNELKSVPLIFGNWDEPYQSQSLSDTEIKALKSKHQKELTKLSIDGLYFTQKKDRVIIAFSIISREYPNKKNQYALLKKEDNLWWRFIGTL